MAMMSGGDLKAFLRKLEFPYCCREALTRLEQLCLSQVQFPKQIEEIMEEFIFCETDRRGARRKRLNSIQELQLLEVLCDYFAYPANEVGRNTVFMTLFTPHPSAPQEKMRILTKLVSVGISTKNIPVLKAAGLWMQQLGCSSRYSLDLAEVLVKDYFVLVPKAVTWLHDLPQMTPHFTANFLTAVAELYSGLERRASFHPPPLTLLETITDWISNYPHLCVAALLMDTQASLPRGSIPMAAVTPFAGLIKWCVEAPLRPDRGSGSSPPVELPICRTETISNKLKFKHEEKGCITTSRSPFYSQLHLALLESLVDIAHSRVLNRQTTCGIISAQHLAVLCESTALLATNQSLDSPELNIALDRLGQAIQIALETRSVFGNIQDLFTSLKKLPLNRLIQVVVKNCS